MLDHPWLPSIICWVHIGLIIIYKNKLPNSLTFYWEFYVRSVYFFRLTLLACVRFFLLAYKDEIVHSPFWKGNTISSTNLLFSKTNIKFGNFLNHHWKSPKHWPRAYSQYRNIDSCTCTKTWHLWHLAHDLLPLPPSQFAVMGPGRVEGGTDTAIVRAGAPHPPPEIAARPTRTCQTWQHQKPTVSKRRL